MELNELRLDIARNQKRGLHFILAAIFIWTLILVSQLLDLSLLQQNMFIFCGSAVLIPFALLASKILHVDFQGKGNPLSKLGLLFSLNQLVYILIAMWAMAEAPSKMLMIFAIIFGARVIAAKSFMPIAGAPMTYLSEPSSDCGTPACPIPLPIGSIAKEPPKMAAPR